MKCDCGIETKREVPVFPWRCACGAVWLAVGVREAPLCEYLGEPTGETVDCSCCGDTGATVAVMGCQIHGRVTMRKVKPRVGPPFDGINCVECRARGLDHE